MSVSAVRVEAVDALRALALLAVVMVNLGGYASLPFDGPLSAPAPSDGALGVGLTVMVAALLQGKGIALLTFLFGYSLGWGHAQTQRLRRLAVLGLTHGFFVYLGDILSQYALFGALLWRRRRERCARLLRRAAVWATLGLLLLLGIGAGMAALPTQPAAAATASLPQFAPWSVWWSENASSYLGTMLGMVLVYGPLSYALMLAGHAAARLRLLQHRRWRPLWRRAARWAGPLLLLNLGYAGLLTSALLDRGPGGGDWMLLSSVLGPLTLLAWVPWLLLRWAPAPPRGLALAGRQTLSLYVGSSVVGMLLYARWAGGWTPPLAAYFGVAALVWLLGSAAAAWASARGLRLPLEAWLARRRAERP